SILMPETAKEISEKPEVREELARTTGEKTGEKVKAATRDKFWFVTHGLLLLGCAVLYYVLGSRLIPLGPQQIDLARRAVRGTALIVLVLGLAKAVSVYVIGRIDDALHCFGHKFQIALIRDLKFYFVPDVRKQRPGIIPYDRIEHFGIGELDDPPARVI